MSHPSTITAAVLDQILAFLTPLFLSVVAGDTEAARQAARALLDSYEARTNRELRLAALAIAFGFGALDALSRAVDPALVVGQVLRLRGNANALSRSAVQNETLLNKLHRQPPEAAETEAEPLPASTATPDLLSLHALPGRAAACAVRHVVDAARRRDVAPAAPRRRASGGKAAQASAGGSTSGTARHRLAERPNDRNRGLTARSSELRASSG